MEDSAYKMDAEILWKNLDFMSDQSACIAFDEYVKNGGDIHYRNVVGGTFLHRAAGVEKDKCLRKLVELGIAVNDVDINDVTALHCAVHTGYEPAILTLLELGGDPKIEMMPGRSAFTHAQRLTSPKWQRINEAFKAQERTNIDAKSARGRKRE